MAVAAVEMMEGIGGRGRGTWTLSWTLCGMGTGIGTVVMVRVGEIEVKGGVRKEEEGGGRGGSPRKLRTWMLNSRRSCRSDGHDVLAGDTRM